MKYFKNFILSFFFISFFVFADLMPFFQILESKDSTEQEVNAVISTIIKQGTKVIPEVQDRYKKTRNPRYLYILEKLQNVKLDMETYFKNKLREAYFCWNKGDREKAKKIAEAILILEPNISFAPEIKDFLKKIEKKDITILKATIQPLKTYYTHGEEIELQINIQNLTNTQMRLANGDKSQIILEITERIFPLQGSYKTTTTTKSIKINGNIQLEAHEKIVYKTKLANTFKDHSYRIYTIKANIPICRILLENKAHYNKITFAEINVHSYPEQYKTLTQNPWKQSLLALEQKNIVNLFYASFFLRKEEKVQLIPLLIQELESATKMSSICYIILQRITQKNYSSTREWKIWWEANKNFKDTIVKDAL